MEEILMNRFLRKLSSPKHFLLLLAACVLPYYSFAQFYNGSQTDFGQNRVQYQDFKWNYYKFPKYEVYYNTGGKELAIYVARAAKRHIAEIEKFFDYTVDDRIQFIVYNKQEDFKQSNIGLNTEDGTNVGGVTHIVGRKVFLYYENDHVSLEEQIRAGIAEVLINQMMYGGNVRDMVKNSTLLNLPEWYTKGLISYVAKAGTAKRITGCATESTPAVIKNSTISQEMMHCMQANPSGITSRKNTARPLFRIFFT
jgi:hypothetical protein